MRRRILGAAALGAAVLAIVAAAYAAVSVSFSATVSPNKAGKATGLFVNIQSRDSAAPQPPIMNRILIRLNKGGKYNASRFKRCRRVVLQARGPKSCPKGSQIGTGVGVGRALPVVEDPVNGRLTLFNGDKQGGKDTVLVYVFPDLGPTFVTVCKVSGGNTVDCTIPPIKTLPSAPDASVVSVKTRTPVKRVKKGKRKHYLMVAPRRCSGTWKGSGTFFFATGETVTVPISQKCRK